MCYMNTKFTNPIVSGDTLHLSRVDMLDGTPVV